MALRLPIEQKKDILLLGAGGHCRAVIDVLRLSSFRPAVILDKSVSCPDASPKELLGVQIAGDDSLLPELRAQYDYGLVTVGQIKTAAIRAKLYARLKECGYLLPVLVSGHASASPWSSIGEGTVVMHFATINAGAVVGANSIINTGAIIEHDAQIGHNCHVSTGAIVNGGAVLADNVFLGSGAIVREGVRIGAGSVIGMGLAVKRDIPPGTLLKHDKNS